MATAVERGAKVWGMIAAGLVASRPRGSLVSQTPPAAEVRPLENRVTRLEAQRVEDVKRLEEIRTNVKELLDRVPPRP
jgi:hypothetical protein